MIPLNAIVTIVRSAPLKLTCNGAKIRQNEPPQLLEFGRLKSWSTMELGEPIIGFIYSNDMKIVYPETQWLMIIIPIKWLFVWEYTLFSDKYYTQ